MGISFLGYAAGPLIVKNYLETAAAGQSVAFELDGRSSNATNTALIPASAGNYELGAVTFSNSTATNGVECWLLGNGNYISVVYLAAWQTIIRPGGDVLTGAMQGLASTGAYICGTYKLVT